MILAAFPLLFTSCASYKHAKKIKMVSFSDDVSKGKSMGAIEGADCTFMVLGYWLGGQPTLDKAFANSSREAGTMESAGLSTTKSKRTVRYINNVSTENSGFNYGIFGKSCLEVNGVGYK